MEYTLKIYKQDKRLTRVSKYNSRNKVGFRCVGVYEFDRKDDAAMDREVKELASLYPSPMFQIEYAPTYVTRKNIMTGEAYQEHADTPWFASPSSETYWST